jgi:hypothetical protein
MNTGIEINPNVVKKVREVCEKKKDFAIFGIQDNKFIVHITSFPESDQDVTDFNLDNDKENNWKQRVYPKLIDALNNEPNPLYIILDFKYVIDGRKCSKLYFIGWCPEKCHVKQKMIFSGTFRHFADMVNIPIRLTAHDMQDITYQELYGRSEKL